MLTITKNYEESFTPTLNGIAVTARYASSTPVVWFERSVATHANKEDDKTRIKPKTVTHFPKRNINIKIQLQS